jgi:hypothetical protein
METKKDYPKMTIKELEKEVDELISSHLSKPKPQSYYDKLNELNDCLIKKSNEQ